jgi:hypothetical protein
MTLAMTCGNSTNASATLASNRPSCANTRWLSSHALEIDSFAIAFPLVTPAYAGPGGFVQRRLLSCLAVAI